MTTGLFCREPELDELSRVWKDVQARRRPAVVGIAGTAGSGKTSLLDVWLSDVGEAQSAFVARGWCNQLSGRSVAYQPFEECVRALLASSTSLRASPAGQLSTAGAAWSAVLSSAPALMGWLVRRPGVADLQAVGVRHELIEVFMSWAKRPSSLETRLEPGQAVRLIRDFFFGLAESAPVIIVVEDAHWADEGTLAVADRLAQPEEAGIMLIVSYRDDGPDGDVQRRLGSLTRRGTRIDLNVATKERASEFCSLALRAAGARADEADVNELVRQSGGNALFATEMAKAGSRERLRGATQVEAILSEKLSAIQPPLIELLEIGSVQGEVFAAEPIAAVQRRPLLAVLTDLEALGKHAGLVDDVSLERRPGDSASFSLFRFRHGLYRDHIYHSQIGPARRRELHRLVGLALEEELGSASAEQAAELAEHFAIAGDQPRSQRYFATAARRNFELAAFAEAARCAEAGIRVSDPGHGGEDAEDLYLIAASSARLRGLFTEASVFAEEGLRHYPESRGHIRRSLMSELARSLYNRDREMDRAAELLEEALGIAGEFSTYSDAELSRQLAVVRQRIGDYAGAVDAYLAAIEIAVPANGLRDAVELINGLGLCWGLIGRFELACECHSAALQLSQHEPGPVRRTLFLNDMTPSLRRLGRIDDARAAVFEAAELAKRQGKTGAHVRALHEQAVIARLVDSDLERAESLLTEALTYTEELHGQGPSLARCAMDLIWIHAVGDRPNDAARAADLLGSLVGPTRAATGTTELWVPAIYLAAAGAIDLDTEDVTLAMSAEVAGAWWRAPVAAAARGLGAAVDCDEPAVRSEAPPYLRMEIEEFLKLVPGDVPAGEDPDAVEHAIDGARETRTREAITEVLGLAG